jgi:hypothetical protein
LGLFKSFMPHEVFDVIKTDIVTNPLLRRRAECVLVLSVDEDGERISLRQSINFRLCNNGHRPYLKDIEVRSSSAQQSTDPTLIKARVTDGAGRPTAK